MTILPPEEQQLKKLLGGSWAAWEQATALIQKHYKTETLWNHGGKAGAFECKFRSGGRTLCCLYARENCFGFMVIFGKEERAAFEARRSGFSQQIVQCYEQTHTYHDGKWMLLELSDEKLLPEIEQLLFIKKRPKIEKVKVPVNKVDFKKTQKELYLPPVKPVLVTVPPLPFLMVNGSGSPDGEEYQNAVAVLYALTFTIKMSKMGSRVPDGYFDYVVPPLEGLWWGKGEQFDLDDRDSWQWTSMIRQPEFVTPEVFDWAVAECRVKKPSLDCSIARLETFDEGLCVQMMHIGPFSEEGATTSRLHRFMEENNLRNCTGDVRKHHEIYMNDPRRVSPEKMKTVLRLPVEQ